MQCKKMQMQNTILQCGSFKTKQNYFDNILFAFYILKITLPIRHPANTQNHYYFISVFVIT